MSEAAEAAGTLVEPIVISSDQENEPGNVEEKEPEPDTVLGQSYSFESMGASFNARNEWRLDNAANLAPTDDFEDWRHEAEVDLFTEGLSCMKCKTYTSFCCCNCDVTLCAPCGHVVGDCCQMCVHCYAKLCNAMERNLVPAPHGMRILRGYPLQFNKRPAV